MKMSRVWAMPNKDTFLVPLIGEFVKRYSNGVIVDPFARNSKLATHTNDLNPETSAQYHMDAEDFVRLLVSDGIKADTVVFDPPYSIVQVVKSYQSVGLKRDSGGAWNGRLYSRVRDAITEILNVDGTVLSFGWNSGGMGKKRGFEIIEIMLVCHGGAHNDTICMAERKI